MTTIITIVVVALVFFVTVCIVTFMVWKREAEMRTDSIKAIEHNVEEMLHELTGGSSGEIRSRAKREEFHRDYNAPQHKTNDRVEEVHSESSREESVKPAQAVQKNLQDKPEQEHIQKVDEGVTVFDPAAIQYTSFERGEHLSERDGKRGLRWKEIQQPQQPEDAPEVRENSVPSESLESSELPEEPIYEEPPEVHEPRQIFEEQREFQQRFESQPEFIEDSKPESIDEPQPIQAPEDELPLEDSANHDEPTPIYSVSHDELVSASSEVDEEQETEVGGPLSKFLKRHKKNKENQEPEGLEEETSPQQEMYESIEDLLKDYISEPHSSEEEFEESIDEIRYEPEFETYYSEPIKPGYDVGKSGKKYTAAELEALIKE